MMDDGRRKEEKRREIYFEGSWSSSSTAAEMCVHAEGCARRGRRRKVDEEVEKERERRGYDFEKRFCLVLCF